MNFLAWYSAIIITILTMIVSVDNGGKNLFLALAVYGPIAVYLWALLV